MQFYKSVSVHSRSLAQMHKTLLQRDKIEITLSKFLMNK